MQKKQYNEEQPIYRSRRHRRKKTNWLPYILLLVAFILAAVAGALFASSSLFDKHVKGPSKDNLMVARDKTIVMIMGVDQRDDDVGRSDTLMIATLDPKKKKAAILSIPRDTRVKIKGHGFDKINAAYAYGGHNLTQSTVENLLGVEMEHYVLINVKAFQKIIDAIGGIDINVEKRMYYEDPWDDDGGLLIDLRPGPQHMDGKTAITYVRYRDEEGDIGRIGRQQKFMQAVMDKLTSPSIIPNIPSIIKEIISSIETDLSIKQMIELASALKEAQANGLQTEMLPGKPMYIGGVSYWLPDLSKLRTTVANTLDIQITSDIRSAMERESVEYENSIPADAQEIPLDDSTRKRLGLDKEASEDAVDNSKDDKKTKKKKDAVLKDNYEEADNARVPKTDSSAPKQQAPQRPQPTAPVAPAPAPSAGKTSN